MGILFRLPLKKYPTFRKMFPSSDTKFNLKPTHRDLKCIIITVSVQQVILKPGPYRVTDEHLKHAVCPKEESRNGLNKTMSLTAADKDRGLKSPCHSIFPAKAQKLNSKAMDGLKRDVEYS
jgi:hypothetical protein